MDVKRHKPGEILKGHDDEESGLEEGPEVKILNEQIFSPNSLVTDCFLGFLQSSEILTCSLVCRKWNTVTREYLQRRRQCLLKVDLTDDGLQDRVQVLQNGILDFNHPFTGIKMEFTDTVKIRDAVDLNALQHLIRTNLRTIFELVSVENVVMLSVNDSIVEFMLPLLPVNKMENWTIYAKDKVFWLRIFRNVRTTTEGFSSLKSITIDYTDPYSSSNRFFPRDYEEIIRCFPVLKELNAVVEQQAIDIFGKYNKLSLIKKLRVNLEYYWNLTFGDRNYKNIEKLSNSLAVLLVNKSSIYCDEDFKFISWMLQKTSSSLRKFGMRVFYFDEFFKLSTPPLLNVEEVTVDHNSNSSWRKYEETISNHLKRIFPNARIIPYRVS